MLSRGLVARGFSTSAGTQMRVIPVPNQSDNYAYLIIDDASRTAAAVDPFDVPKVTAAAEKEGVQIVAGITTHHHVDHSGGNKEFLSKYPDTPMYAGSTTAPAITHVVKDKSEFTLGSNVHIKALHTPCHTQDSICFYVHDRSTEQKGVFTGDTLFRGGCGRFFEGTAEEMHAALSYLAMLPDSTVVYDGHEYTKGNLAFAKSVEPETPGVIRLAELVSSSPITTGKSSIRDEKEWNVFMRPNSELIHYWRVRTIQNYVQASEHEEQFPGVTLSCDEDMAEARVYKRLSISVEAGGKKLYNQRFMKAI